MAITVVPVEVFRPVVGDHVILVIVVGKVGGDAGQIAVEGIKEASKIRVPRKAPRTGAKLSEEEIKAGWERYWRSNPPSVQRHKAFDYPLPERRESHYGPSGAGMPVREH